MILLETTGADDLANKINAKLQSSDFFSDETNINTKKTAIADINTETELKTWLAKNL